MYPTLFHIYGPIKLHSFSVMLGIGIFVFIYIASRAIKNKNLMSIDQFQEACVQASLVGLIGARLLHILSEPTHYTTITAMLSIWNGGMSIFGGLIAVTAYALWYLWKNNLSFATGLEILDTVAIYIPLAHAIARIGCLLAGCCYGKATSLPWSIMYTNSECSAPLYMHLHPTQLYSAALFFGIFLVLYMLEKRKMLQVGQYAMVYLLLSSLERLSVDFLRGDRIMHIENSLSFHQLIAIGICAAALLGFSALATQNKRALT